MRSWLRLAVVSAMVGAAGCGAAQGAGGGADPSPAASAAAARRPACDADNGGITLPAGFCAVVVADQVGGQRGRARHIAVAPDGRVYVSLQGANNPTSPGERGGIVALRDADGDGKAEERAYFGPAEAGTGLELRDGYLYFATNSAVLRYRLGSGLEPVGGPDTLVTGLPAQHSHAAKSIALGPGDALFVNIGSPTNACQPLGQDRAQGVRGEDPCPQLETRAGVWRFEADELRQTQARGERWATGIRNAVAIAWNPADGNLWVAQHGRDQLNNWPGFTAEDNAERPAEELQRLTRGADFGWPYCFFDTRTRRRLLAPEYGGNGEEVGRCADKALPVAAFPGHWAPNDLHFYTGRQFPARFRNGAFIAFHGSWNRAPLPQAGYRVVFQPLDGARAAGAFEDFATGFSGATPTPNAQYRPMGLAQGPDGSLYVTSSNNGRIWRVMYTG